MSENSSVKELGRNAKILVVDDDPDIQQITKLNLMAEGFEVLQAFSGVDCMEVLKTEVPDLIMMDLMMPEMDGFETVKRIKAIATTREIPVIMVTVREAISDKLRCFGFKADDYVVKPYEFEELLARVYLHLNQTAATVERDRTARVAMSRDLLKQLSEQTVPLYHRFLEAFELAAADPDSAALEQVRAAGEAMMRTIEAAREHEDPFYESPVLAPGDHEDFDDELDLEDLDLPADFEIDQ